MPVLLRWLRGWRDERIKFQTPHPRTFWTRKEVLKSLKYKCLKKKKKRLPDYDDVSYLCSIRWRCHMHAHFSNVGSHQTISKEKVWASRPSAITCGTKSVRFTDGHVPSNLQRKPSWAPAKERPNVGTEAEPASPSPVKNKSHNNCKSYCDRRRSSLIIKGTTFCCVPIKSE